MMMPASSFQISGVLALVCHGHRGAVVLIMLALLVPCAAAYCSPYYCRVLLLA
jgi:hypothetical protein